MTLRTSSRLIALIGLVMIAAACGGGEEKTESPSATPAQSPTPEATITLLPATWTPAPTLTPATLPTYEVTARPTATPFMLPTYTPPFVLAAITAGSAARLTQIEAFEAGPVSDMVWSPDGLTLALSTSDGVRLYADGNFFNLVAVVQSEDRSALAETRCVAFSPDGTKLATGNTNGDLNVWSIGTAPSVLWEIKDVAIHDCVFASNGAMLVTGGAEHQIKVWDPATGDVIHEYESESDEVYTLAIYPLRAPVLVSGGDADIPEVWNLDTQELLAAPRGHESDIHASAFSPDGESFATGDSDGTARVWTVAGAQNDRPQAVLEGTDQIAALAYSPDGSLLAAGLRDGKLVVWNVATSQELIAFEAHFIWIDAVVWSPDGMKLLTAGPDGVHVWGVKGE